MRLTPKEIEQVATLARLSLTAKEKKVYAEQISVVLDYVGMLNEVNTEGVGETCQVTGLEDVMRKDEAVDCDPAVREKIIEQFPEKVGRLLKVKAVFE